MLDLNILHKNYTLNQNGFQLKLPLNLECIIPENDSVRLLSQFVEAMDLTDLYSTYERIRENHASPRILLKIVLYSEYSCAMKSHFRKFGNQMSGSRNHLCNYASLLA